MPDRSPLPLMIAIPAPLARRWVMYAASIAALGYTVMTALVVFGAQTTVVDNSRHSLIAAAVSALAVLAAYHNRVLLGGVMCILATFWQIQFAYFVSVSIPVPATMVTPVLIVGAALVLGTRWSLALALLSIALSWPLMLRTPALASSGMTTGAVYWLVLHALVTIAAWSLISLSLRALARTMADLRAQDADLRETIRVAPDGILVVNAEEQVVIANPAAATVFGVERDACEGRTLRDLFAEADFGTSVPAGILAKDAPETRWEWTTSRGSGAPLHLELAWRRMEAGRRQLTMQDVSARVNTDTTRRMIESRLAHAQRLESIGLLAAGIAHDFNNILTVVGGCAELLQRGGLLPAPELASEILAAHARGTALTQQLLSFARREPVQPAVLDLAAHLNGLERFLQRVAGEQVRIVLQVGADCPIRIDVAQFEQAMLNLVSNARDAMPDGGECRITAVRVASAEGAAVQLRVSDTGIGMDAVTIERAFDPFFTTKTRGRGTGLGLAVLHGAVTAAGGTVAIESSPGQGTTVSMHFPVAEIAPPQPVRDAGPARDHPQDSGLVLVVEDDDGTRQVAGRMLSDLGYSVLLASSGEDALTLAESHRDDLSLLLTDVMMPGMLGPDLARQMQALLPTLPVLFMSGYPGEALSAVPGLQLETDFMVKPFNRDTLARLARGKIIA
jgi:two-component system, cell cycle sensor histidine kinase and response regulator CckA